MHTFLSFIKKIGTVKKESLYLAQRSFSPKQLFLFSLLVFTALISTIILLQKINNKFLVAVPTKGGEINEGIIGIPTKINPVLAFSDADEDLVSIVYSGLLRKDSDGNFIPDLAQSYTVDPTGTVYNFVLKDNITFHDSKKLTADDVVFTIDKMQDAEIKSPNMLTWSGVTVAKIDDRTVSFTLKQPYISFIDNMTFGVLPKHIWDKIDNSQFAVSPLNTKAIGSGPYKIDSVTKDKDGIPQKYVLSAFKKFILGRPNVKKINIFLYSNEKDEIDALKNNQIDQAGGISAENIGILKEDGYVVNESTLPRMFGLFFNKDKNKVLLDSDLMNAIKKAINKQEIVDNVLYGYGEIISNPIPNTIFKNDTTKQSIPNIDEINSILDKTSWKMNADGIREKSQTTTITKTKKVGKKTVTEQVTVQSKGQGTLASFTLTTGNTPELQSTSNKIKEQLARIGIQVVVKTYENGQLSQIIRSRDYEALFFGQILNHESDLFSFWHSSQRNDPGLNIANYNNPKIDALLASAQRTIDKNERVGIYKSFVDEYNNDNPAILIYSPKYLYVTKTNINNVNPETITKPNDRFSSVYQWYAKQDYVWKIFTK